ncbi:MAG TPA: signal peptidase I, partial [Opitutaceae bacterium]
PAEARETERVAALESALEQQAAELANLRAELARYRAWMDSVALPGRNRPAAKGSLADSAPTSGLDREAANRAAMAARLMVSGGGALTVLPTGSMRPTFDQNAILLTEPARFDDIRVGDIVTFKHPSYPVPVVHRVLEKRGDRFWSRGDANGRMDDIYITRENFDRRVFGIIYGSEAVATQFVR